MAFDVIWNRMDFFYSSDFMPIKISNGYRFRSLDTLEAALMWVKTIRPQVYASYYQYVHKEMITSVLASYLKKEIVKSSLPLFSITGEEETLETLGDVYQKLIDDIRRSEKEGEHHYLSPQSSICVLPAQPGASCMFGLFTNNSNIREFIDANEAVESYEYNNQVDKGLKTTVKEWKKRKEIWGKVLPKWSSFSENGVTIDILSSIDARLMKPDSLPPHLNDEWYCLESLAEQLALSSDLRFPPGWDEVPEAQRADVLFRYTWKIMSKRVSEFNELQEKIKRWIPSQNLELLYQQILMSLK